MRNVRLAGKSNIQTIVLIAIVVIVIVVIIRAGMSKKPSDPVTVVDQPTPASIETKSVAATPVQEEAPEVKKSTPAPVKPKPESIQLAEVKPDPEPAAKEEPETPQERTSRQMRTIRFAMLSFQREKGRLPSEEEFSQPIFTDLLDPEIEINSEGFPVDSWGNPLKFNPSMGVAFGFVSTGPDGLSGTKETNMDDVR